MTERALVERAQVIREMQRLQRRRIEPVYLPSRRSHHRIPVTAG